MPAAAAARESASLGVPMIATACVASAVGFAVLAFSSIPLVSQFGLLLGGGVLVCLLVHLPGRIRRCSPSVASAAPDTERGRAMTRLKQLVKPVLGTAIVAPGRVLALAILLGAIGWAVSTQAETRTEIGQLLPSQAPVVKDLLDVEETDRRLR